MLLCRQWFSHCTHTAHSITMCNGTALQQFDPQIIQETSATWEMRTHVLGPTQQLDSLRFFTVQPVSCKWTRSYLCHLSIWHGTQQDPQNQHRTYCAAPYVCISSDGMEAGCPGCMMTTGGLPTNKHFRSCSFWINHFLPFVYVTMHESKKAEELIKSKLEFEEFASKYNVITKDMHADTTACILPSYSKMLVYENNKDLPSVQWVHTGRTVLQSISLGLLPCGHAQYYHMPWQDGQALWLKIFGLSPFSMPSPFITHRFDEIKMHHHVNSSPGKRHLGSSMIFACSTVLSMFSRRNYNPTTTHISPQLRLVFDESFTSITSPHNHQNDSFLEQLYN